MKYSAVFLLSVISWDIHGQAAVKCPVIRDVETFSQCVLTSHPDLRAHSARRSKAGAAGDIASQGPNPELSGKFLYGLNGNHVSAEVNATHTFELGGKKTARQEYAARQMSLVQANLIIESQEALLGSLLQLVRRQQTIQERAVLEQATTTFQRLVNNYNQVPRLSPEQQAHRAILKMAQQEYGLQLRLLAQEEAQLSGQLSLAIGGQAIDWRKMNLLTVQRWPKVKALDLDKAYNSPYLHRAKAKLGVGRAAITQANSLGWPDFSIGPSYEYARDGGDRNAIGFNFKVSAPLYHQNQGEKKLAHSTHRLASIEFSVLKDKISAEREVLRQMYFHATQNFVGINYFDFYKKQQVQLDKLSLRGLVSAPALLEAHRQKFDLLRSFHENQRMALWALWSIYAIDGTIFKQAGPK